MAFIVSGILLWAAVHLVPSLGFSFKQKTIERFGEGLYKAVFSVLLLSSVALIIYGWRTNEPVLLYLPIENLRPFALFMVLLGFLFIGAAKNETRLKQYVRHPQLTGLVIWASAHLILNGDSSSVALFAGLGLWAAIEIPLISRREGAWVKPPVPSWGVEIKGQLISLAIFAVLLFAHPFIAGVSVF